MIKSISHIGSLLLPKQILGDFGRFIIFCYHCLLRLFQYKIKYKLILQQIEFIGIRSIIIIVMASFVIGAVFAIQFGKVFSWFGVESLIGAAASFAITKELAPVIGTFLVVGRAGSAFTAELASMRVSDQIDAVVMSAVDPISYLAIPRIIASMIATPMLTAIFMFTGVLSSYVLGLFLFEIDPGVFIERIGWITEAKHIFQGLFKACIFAAIFSVICCYKGFYATGGAKGVGRATTSAVVWSLVTILISDFFISYLQRDAFLS